MSSRGPVDDKRAAKAAKLYQMWHQKYPKGVLHQSFKWQDESAFLGHASDIVYYSDKWENDGDGFEYCHTFDSHPSIYTPVGRAEADACFQSGVQLKETTHLLRTHDLDGAMAWPILAVVYSLEFVHEDENGKKKKREIHYPKPPKMLCTPDRKTLIILDKQPLLIRGGQMVVTRRGIVN